MEFNYKRLGHKHGEMLMAASMMNVGGFVFPIFDNTLRSSKVYEQSISCFRVVFTNEYMSPITMYKCEDKELEIEYSPDTSWMQILRGVLKSLPKDRSLSCRIETPRYSAQLTILPPVIKMEGERRTSLIMFLTDAKLNYTTLLAYNVTEDEISNKGFGFNPINTIFYYEGRYKCAKKIIDSEKQYAVNGILPVRLVTALKQLMYLASTNSELSTDNLKYPVYSSCEIRMLRRFLNYEGCNLIANLRGYATPLNSSSGDMFSDMLEESNFKHDWSEYPMVDLSTKELKFIDNYCNKLKFCCSSDDTIPIDLGKLLTESRLNYMRYPISDDLPDVLYYSDVNQNDNIARIWFIQKIACGRIEIVVDLINIDNFNLTDNLTSIKKRVVMTDTSVIPSNYEEFVKESPIIDSDAKEILVSLINIFQILIVMRDRPQRTKVIKCTEKREVNPSNNKKHQKKVEKEFVIQRILKSTSDAKEYIHRMSSSSDRHVEYTMEEWERRAHTRQLKSGKIIYIHETTCHRHKELSDKEVHIKL